MNTEDEVALIRALDGCPEPFRELALKTAQSLLNAPTDDSFAGSSALVVCLTCTISRLTSELERHRSQTKPSANAKLVHDVSPSPLFDLSIKSTRGNSEDRKVIPISGRKLLIALAVSIVGVFFSGWLSHREFSHPQAFPASPQKPLTEYHVDHSSPYLTSDGSLGATWALEAVSRASSSIVWITNDPVSDRLLDSLRQKRDEGLSVLIIVGASTNLESAKAAVQLGLSVYRSPISLEPESLFFVDGNLVVDGNRQQTAWRSSEPTIVKEVKDWINSVLLPNRQPLELKSDTAGTK